MPLLRMIGRWLRRSTTDERSVWSRPIEPWTPGYTAGGAPANEALPIAMLVLIIVVSPLLLAAVAVAGAYELVIRLDAGRRLPPVVHWLVAVPAALLLAATAVSLVR